MAPLKIEDGEQLQPQGKGSVAHRDGVSGPRFRPEKSRPVGVCPMLAAEVARALALLSPLGEMVAGLVEHQQLMRAAVGDHEPPVPEPEGVVHPMQLEGLLTPYRADGEDGFRPNRPAEPRTLGRSSVLDDPDAGAVPNLVLRCRLCAGLGPLWVGVRAACVEGDQRDERCRARGQSFGHAHVFHGVDTRVPRCDVRSSTCRALGAARTPHPARPWLNPECSPRRSRRRQTRRASPQTPAPAHPGRRRSTPSPRMERREA